MATFKQKRLVDKIIKNNGNFRKSMKEVGYSESTARVPKVITESKGFKEVCAQKGLTESFIVDALVEDINAKPGNRIGELGLGSKILGLQDKHEVDGNITITWE